MNLIERYVTNFSTTPSDLTREVEAELFTQAAKISGQNVEVRKHPIPKDFSNPEDNGYDPSSVRDCWSLWFSGETYDLSKFWRAYDKLRKAVLSNREPPK